MSSTAKTPVASHTTQSVTVNIRAAGDQQVTVDTHGQRAEQGSHISVAAPGAVVYAYDPNAASTYIRAFLSPRTRALLSQIPDRISSITDAELRAERTSPAVMIRAYGTDTIRAFLVPEQSATHQAVAIRIGGVTWLIEDHAAYRSYAAAWAHVNQLTPIVLGMPSQPLSAG